MKQLTYIILTPLMIASGFVNKFSATAGLFFMRLHNLHKIQIHFMGLRCAILLAGFLISCNPAGRDQEITGYYTVMSVVDGDTFRVDDGSAKGLKIRLIGIDAPETRKSEHKNVGYYGVEAKNYLRQMIGNKQVKLVFDVERYDQYGRTLAYAYLRDGTFINADLVKNGYARVVTFPPNVRFADVFYSLQRKARLQKKGMWKDQNIQQ
jgi:micrococcal nuclease